MYQSCRASLFLYPVLILTIIMSCCLPAYPAEPDYDVVPTITADAAILMDAGTGQILFEKDANLKKPPASTTKIMTALLALEGGDLHETVTVSPNAASVGEASLELQEGEMLTLQDLLYGALLESGNDACVALAEHICGTESNFVLLMNEKAKLIGADASSFKNTNGLPTAGHYTTARDLATIARYALRNSVFKQIVGTRSKIIESSMGTRHLSNTNRMLWSYEGSDGIKTGTTLEAGSCLVASATRQGRKLICVVLNSEDRWRDSIELLDYGFNNFVYLRVVEQGTAVDRIKVEEGVVGEITAVALADLDVVVPIGGEGYLEKVVSIERQITAPVLKGQPTGRITAKFKGEVVGSVELIASHDVERMPNYRLFWENRNFLPI